MSRSKFKGPFIDTKKNSLIGINKKKHIVENKNQVILPIHINKLLSIHNGKNIIKKTFQDLHVNCKLGEFITTRKICKHKLKKKKK